VINISALVTSAGAAAGGVAAWVQSRRSGLAASVRRLERESQKKDELVRLLTAHLIALTRWAQSQPVGPAGPPPTTPAGLDLLLWAPGPDRGDD
jgi:hypothetical protein